MEILIRLKQCNQYNKIFKNIIINLDNAIKNKTKDSSSENKI